MSSTSCSVNYYEILECNPSATYDELKKSYQTLVKQNHPDKQQLKTNRDLTSNNFEHNKTSDKFLLIDEAWKVLRDPNQRKIYDSTKLQSEVSQNSVIYAEITSSSLVFNDSVAYYLCRCGENIEIHQDNFVDLSKGEEILFECSECSNNILVIYC